MDNSRSAVSPFSEHRLRDSEDSFICRRTRLAPEETPAQEEPLQKPSGVSRRMRQSREILKIHERHAQAMKSAGQWKSPDETESK
ncbi:MAG: hypothetical protein PHI27_08435 [Eubacteriales bacterium]|nr:hypothetical protein [Eubacteriales bacterium]MDD3882265.1 hypothetical protein [Eubacteriales bacterium]MDD4512011.1 hypothetical protein [Eubacteriales bacterium]